MFARASVSASLIALAFSVGTTAALAQSRRPAETPPASFAGSQYVDSKGCVFIRAGSGGMVTWVPRMDRARTQICNASPSLAASAPAAATTRTTSGSASDFAVATRSAPAGTSYGVTVAPGYSTLSGPARVPAAPAPVTNRASGTAPSCLGASPLSSQYINHGQHGPVRCGPQAVHPGGLGRSGSGYGTTSGQVPSILRGAPFEPVNANPQVAAGYRPVWTDGRLNENRGPQSDVVYLSEASTSAAPQVRASTRGVPTATRARTVATDAAPTRAAPAATGGHRFVQVGTYGDKSNADRAVRRLQAMGLPVSRSALRSGGRELAVILAGPFTSASDLRQALGQARRSGYGDAFTR